jgi:L-aminopeptidase/D-esterase-like protein
LIRPRESFLDALVFAGGSVFGFPSIWGVVEYLREIGQGEKIRSLSVPIVAGAVLFDLFLGSPVGISPEKGYEAIARGGSSVPVGSEGAGTGALSGKLFGTSQATKTGGGFAGIFEPIPAGVYVVLNPFGEVRGREGRIVAGVRDLNRKGGFLPMEEFFRGGDFSLPSVGGNTTLIFSYVSAKLLYAERVYLGDILLNTLSRVVSPSGTLMDGDLAVVASGGESPPPSLYLLGEIVSDLLLSAVDCAVKESSSLHGVPSYREWVSVE